MPTETDFIDRHSWEKLARSQSQIKFKLGSGVCTRCHCILLLSLYTADSNVVHAPRTEGTYEGLDRHPGEDERVFGELRVTLLAYSQITHRPCFLRAARERERASTRIQINGESWIVSRDVSSVKYIGRGRQ